MVEHGWIQVVYLKETYVPEEFADLLEVLFFNHMLRRSGRQINGSSSVWVLMGLHDAMFEDCDSQHLLISSKACHQEFAKIPYAFYHTTSIWATKLFL